MRWGRYGVKSARRIVCLRRAREGVPQADNDVAIAGIGEILLPVGEAAGARSGMIRFSL